MNLCPTCFSFITDEAIYTDTYKCKKCGEVKMTPGNIPFEVDSWVIKPIQRMNKKGYKTVACCEGHKEMNAIPYVTFGEDYYEILDKYIGKDSDLKHIRFDERWRLGGANPRLEPSGWLMQDNLKMHYYFCKEINKLSKRLPNLNKGEHK